MRNFTPRLILVEKVKISLTQGANAVRQKSLLVIKYNVCGAAVSITLIREHGFGVKNFVWVSAHQLLDACVGCSMFATTGRLNQKGHANNVYTLRLHFFSIIIIN